jgi:4'-phosphopantetheinyl transferase EntD
MIFATAFGEFPIGAFVEHTFDVDPLTLNQLDMLYPLPDHLHRAVLKRQVEFLAGRVCAQQALEVLPGHKPGAIPPQPDRAPGWPPGIVGSITHTKGYAAALVALETHYQGLGVDRTFRVSPRLADDREFVSYCVAHRYPVLGNTPRAV